MYGSAINTIAVLPRAPVNGSPVPGLTSLYHKAFAGPYGDRRYPGNCSGELIKDLLRYFRPQRVLDPMTGSGTCADVCREIDVECVSFDIREGRDAADPQSYQGLRRATDSRTATRSAFRANSFRSSVLMDRMDWRCSSWRRWCCSRSPAS